MKNTVSQIAAKAIIDGNALEEVRVHEFVDNEAAHDDEQIEKLYQEFSADFDRVVAELNATYGKPAKMGQEDHDSIPLSGVLRYALWQVDNQVLFVATSHQDREIPILLMLGTTDAEIE